MTDTVDPDPVDRETRDRPSADWVSRAIDDAPDVLLFIATDGVILDARGATQRTYGEAPEAMRGRPMQDFYPRDSDPSEVDALMKRVVAAGGLTFAAQQRHREGHTFPVEISSRFFRHDSREGFLSIVRDVSHRRASEPEILILSRFLMLQRDVHELATAATNQTDFVTSVCARAAGEEGPFALCWVGWKEPSGVVAPAAWAGRDAEAFAKVQARWDEGPLSQGPTGTAIRTVRTVVMSSLTEDTAYAPWVDLASSRGLAAAASVPLRSGGKVVGALGAYLPHGHRFDEETLGALEELGRIVDLGLDRLTAQEAHRAAQDELRRLAKAVDQADEAVMVTNAQGVIEYVNPAFTRITGYAPAEALGNTPRLLKSGGQAPAFYEELWRRLGRGESFSGNLMNRRKDGSTYMASVVISPIVDGDRGVTHFVGLQRDVSQEHAVSEQLRHLQRVETLGTLTGSVAHDFNNLLGVILANVALARDEAWGAAAEGDGALDDIQAAADAGIDLVRKLLSLGRRDALTIQAFDVSAAIERVAGMARRLLPADVSLEVDAPPGLVALGDIGALDQMLINLVVNARDAMPTGGTIRVVARALEGPDVVAIGGRVVLTVSDDGSGMSPEVLARAWEPFFTTKPAGRGTGLGLAMVASLAGQLGATVALQSSPGQGTTVTLGLLRGGPEDVPARGDSNGPVATIRGGQEVILLAEDDERMRRATVRLLEHLGYQVLTAADGAEALAIWERHREAVDVVVTDGEMPRLGGVGLMAALRARGGEIPVLLVSGHPQVAHGAGGDPSGWALLRKPWSLADLDASIRALLDERPAIVL